MVFPPAKKTARLNESTKLNPLDDISQSIGYLRRLQRDTFEDLTGIRTRLTRIERDVSSSLRRARRLATLSASATMDLGVAFVRHGGSAPWVSTAVTLITEPPKLYGEAEQRETTERPKLRIGLRTSANGRAAEVRSVECVAPVSDSLKLKLIPLAETGENGTSGFIESSTSGGFMTDVGKGNVPFLKRCNGHGVALGFQAARNAVLLTVASFVRPGVSVASIGSGGDSRYRVLSNVSDAVAEARSEHPLAHFSIAEAALQLGGKFAIGVVGMHESLSTREMDKDFGNSVGVHGLAIVFDEFCVKGWAAVDCGRRSSMGMSLASLPALDGSQWGVALGVLPRSRNVEPDQVDAGRANQGDASQAGKALVGEAYTMMPVGDDLTLIPSLTLQNRPEKGTEVVAFTRLRWSI